MKKIIARIQLELFLSESLIWPLLMGLSFIVYGSTFGSSVIWDDRFGYIYQNVPNTEEVKFFDVIFKYSWPVTYFITEYLPDLFGKTFYLYKLTNLSIHFINAYLLQKILNNFNLHSKLKWFVIFCFLFHPYQHMAVSWMIQIKTLTATAFLFLSILHFLKIKTNKLFSISSLMFFLLSLKTKFFAILLPFSLILIWPKKIKILIPFCLISIGVFIQFYLSKYFVEEVNVFNLPVGADRLLEMNERLSIFYYLLKHTFVDSIVLINTFPLYNYNFEIYSLIFFLSAFGGVIYLNKSNLRLPLLIIINLVIFSGIMVAPYMRYTPVSDQNFYHLMPLIAIMIYSVIYKIRSKSIITFVVVMIIFSSFYSKTFKHEGTFFEKSLLNSDSYIVYVNLSSYYLEIGMLDEAIEVLEISLDKVHKKHRPVVYKQLQRLMLYPR
jgi:hypothetical protein